MKVGLFGRAMGRKIQLGLIAAMTLLGCEPGAEHDIIHERPTTNALAKDDSADRMTGTSMTSLSPHSFQAQHGYGSPDGYLPGNLGWDDGCQCERARYSTFEAGSRDSGTYVWGFVPDQLVDGERAPIYIYLHGYMTSDPRYYQDHLEHLLKQGYIVIFPIFQPSRFGILNSLGVFNEADQQRWLETAIRESRKLIERRIQPRADTSRVYLFGYSLGGALATRFTRTLSELGVDWKVQGLVLAHPQINSKEGMPGFAAAMVKIKMVDWAEGVSAIDAPTLILSGDKDGIAKVRQVSDLYRALPATTPKAGWKILSDEDGQGVEDVHSDHGSPLCRPGLFLNNAVLTLMGIGKVALNAHDYRIYFAATDAIRDGVVDLPWDLGMNSHGHAYNLPERCDATCQ